MLRKECHCSATGSSHVAVLYGARHLRRLEFYDTAATVAEVQKLQKALAECDVRMTDAAGKLLVGPPVRVPVQTNQDSSMRTSPPP